ncbi:hypothetical protein GF337_10485, partial [candidate division KSB1 bacterium]|nr:hypothetical protein [candidate division KSB1 bacterium]
MNKINDIKCCDANMNEASNLCPELLKSLNENTPFYRSGDDCNEKNQKVFAAFRRESVEKPVIFIGTGTCGLGAGAAKTLNRIQLYVKEREIDAEIIEVGCIGLCVEEPVVDVQLPQRTRISFKQITEDKVDDLLDGIFNNRVLKEHV